MRGSRAKALHRLANANPSPLQTGYYKNGPNTRHTYKYGGTKRTYKNLKRRGTLE